MRTARFRALRFLAHFSQER